MKANTRIVAVVSGNPPDPRDPQSCGEEIVLAMRIMKSAPAARRWIDGVLTTPLPDGILARYGWMRREEWQEEDYGWWEVVAESDTITACERDRETVWFAT